MALHIPEEAWKVARLAREAWRGTGAEGERGGAGDPVVLLHGFAGTPHMLRPLARFTRTRLGRRTLPISLGLGFGDVRDSALRVHAMLEREGVACCDVVGYSLGGIVAAYLLKCLDQGRRIRVVITLGSPHRGVPLVSRWPGLLARLWRSGAQLHPGSALLDSLRGVPMPADTGLLSIAGADDHLVPPDYARVEGCGCRSRVVPGVGHLSLLSSRRVYRLVTRGLRLPGEPGAGAGRLVSRAVGSAAG